MHTRLTPFRRLRSGAAVALGCAALLGVGCRPTEPPPIRIGLIGVYVGAMGGSSGIPARRGAEIAIAEINAGGGVQIGGRAHRLQLVDVGVENRPDAAAVGARQLINLDSVDVIIGPQISTLAIAAGAVAEEAEILMIAPMASNPLVTAGRQFVFRLAFLDAFQGEVLARFAYDSLGIRRAAILHDAASPYGSDISALFAQTFTTLGGRIVALERYDIDGPEDYRPQLQRLLAGDPQALLLPNFVTGDSTQMRQARSLGFRGRFLGTDSWDVRGLASVPGAQGSLIVGNWDRDTTRVNARRFHAAWTAMDAEPPRATAAATYDAIHLVTQAMARAGSRDGTVLADSLRWFGRHEGAVTTYDFRGSNDPVRGAALLELRADGLGVRSSVPPPSR
ncbi:MAG: ABC transporter substrate-binding protein [Gemmatimonadaceae bacterium]|nr:ABC transporter substrate-binding protein [Gemmatimonadaceae bacterium]MCW5825213.1 ABC transporter substrate-binding protein [Gemmatimonadaceae bacterium]